MSDVFLTPSAIIQLLTTVVGVAATIGTVVYKTKKSQEDISKQLKEQALQAERKYRMDTLSSIEKEKRLKIEQVSQCLHEYADENASCLELMDKLTSTYSEEDKKKPILNELQELKIRHTLATRKLHRARVLASAYSDTIGSEFADIQKYNDSIISHYEQTLMHESGQHYFHTDDPELDEFSNKQLYNQYTSSFIQVGKAREEIEGLINEVDLKIINELRNSMSEEKIAQ